MDTAEVQATHHLSSFNLDLLLGVREVTVDGVAAEFRKPNRHELLITPRRTIDRGDRFTVVVRYAVTPSRLGYLGESNWLANDLEGLTMNQPHTAPWWYPANDHPLDPARHDFYITVPRGKDVVANGLLPAQGR